MTAKLTNGWTLDRLLSDVVGSGPKSAADMDRKQAREAFTRILEGEPHPTTLGAFLLALRWKSNTPTELAAFVDVMREGVEVAEPSVDPVDCGANYDGKETSALLGVGSGLVAAGAGTPVVAHSGVAIPASYGTTYRDVLAELGVETDLTPEESAAMTDEVGFGYYYQPRFAPEVHDLLETRERMNVRTFVNTVETLANPANASVHLGSFYHLSFAKRIIDTVAESESLAVDRVLMFQGLEGYDDVRPGETTVAESDGEFSQTVLEIDSWEREDLAVDDVPGESARITEEVLSGEREDAFATAIAQNAGLRIYAGGDADSIEEGIELATAAIEDGSAADRLGALRAYGP
ncbi:anthranilate phosphoribosyltransferase [Natrialbaceae archaeon A-gly3]